MTNDHPSRIIDDEEALSIAQAFRDVGISEDGIAEELGLEYHLSYEDAMHISRKAFENGDVR